MKYSSEFDDAPNWAPIKNERIRPKSRQNQVAKTDKAAKTAKISLLAAKRGISPSDEMRLDGLIKAILPELGTGIEGGIVIIDGKGTSIMSPNLVKILFHRRFGKYASNRAVKEFNHGARQAIETINERRPDAVAQLGKLAVISNSGADTQRFFLAATFNDEGAQVHREERRTYVEQAVPDATPDYFRDYLDYYTPHISLLRTGSQQQAEAIKQALEPETEGMWVSLEPAMSIATDLDIKRMT